MGNILLIRHGETDWNKDRRIMGREPVGLNENGRHQSKQLQEALSDLDVEAVYSSPVLRAMETAEFLCQGRALAPIPDDRLLEVNYGQWVGKTFMEVRAMPGYIPYMQRLETPVAPGGETLYQVRDRAMGFLNHVSELHLDGNILVVSHADWIKCVFMQLLGIPFEKIWGFRVDNTAVALLETEERGFRVLTFNHGADLNHLFVPRVSF
jgi:broad specificity phosphatase PhoE